MMSDYSLWIIRPHNVAGEYPIKRLRHPVAVYERTCQLMARHGATKAMVMRGKTLHYELNESDAEFGRLILEEYK